MSIALAVTLIVPLTDPAAGAVILIVGAVTSLFTFTITSAAVPTFPAASRAVALNACVPLLTVLVFQGNE